MKLPKIEEKAIYNDNKFDVIKTRPLLLLLIRFSIPIFVFALELIVY